VRLSLVLLATVLVGVFALAILLNPYKNGRVWTEGTHRQLGLPPCTFKELTGVPCPTCGMTSSFALLMRADLVHSLQANAAGTLLALFLLFLIPWSVASALRGRLLFFRSLEAVLLRAAIVLLILMLARWGFVLLEMKVLGS